MPAAIALEPLREIWTSEEGSMARLTALTRWPKIVQGMVDDVEQSINNSTDPEHEREGRKIKVALQQLREEMLRNGPLKPLSSSDDSLELAAYNNKLGSFGRTSWHDCPWLFAECYLYRLVENLFSNSRSWRGYDVFARQKLKAFVASGSAVEELSARYMSICDSGVFTDQESYLLFIEMTEIALWGNATDLSLLTTLSLEEIHSLQGKKAIQEGQLRIVSNDMRAAWSWLTSNRGGRVDVVLDNSGFEFFTDLVYSLYLVDSGLASTINFHVKSIPWFVSDVTPNDVTGLFHALSDPRYFPNSSCKTRELAARLKAAFDKGTFKVKEHPFWTSGSDFQEMPNVAPDLLDSLTDSRLVIFKGDLNYRKLVRDACWPHTTPFKDALGPLGLPHVGRQGKPLRILALRTNKADVCVGLDPQTLQRVEREAPNKEWVRNGKYAVVSFSDQSSP